MVSRNNDGGGGVTGDNLPPQRCTPSSPPIVESVKGRIIINVYEGGGTGGSGGTGSGDAPPCPTAPDPAHPVFGINGSNAVIPDANFDNLLNYLEGLGLVVMNPYNDHVTINGIVYTGQITEIRDTNGNVVVAYFSPDAAGGTMQLGFEYSIGNKGPDGSGSSTSSFQLTYNPQSNFGSSVITYSPSPYGGGSGGGNMTLPPIFNTE